MKSVEDVLKESLVEMGYYEESALGSHGKNICSVPPKKDNKRFRPEKLVEIHDVVRMNKDRIDRAEKRVWMILVLGALLILFGIIMSVYDHSIKGTILSVIGDFALAGTLIKLMAFHKEVTAIEAAMIILSTCRIDTLAPSEQVEIITTLLNKIFEKQKTKDKER